MALAEIKSFDSSPPRRWMGWDSAAVGLLLDTTPDVGKIGTALCQVLVNRLLATEETPFEFILYRHAELEDRYCYVGTWNDPAGPTSPAVSVNLFSAAAPDSYTGREEMETTGEYGDELFLPLESHEGVLGFCLLRTLDESSLEEVDDEDLLFLGRIVGQTFGQLLQCDRLEFTHQSMQTTVRYLESVLALSEDAILLLDAEGRIVVANDGVEDYLGQLPIDVVGQLVQDTLPSEGTVALLSGAHLSEMRNEPVTRTLRRRSLLSGETGEIEVVFRSVRHDHGASGVLVRFRDLGVDETNTWYQQQHESSDAGTGALVRPLAAVRGYLGLLRDEVGPNAPAVDLFQAMDTQLEWVQTQLDARILADEFRMGRARWRDRQAHPLGLLTKAMDRVRSRFLQRGIHLCIDVPEGAPSFHLDMDKWSVALGCILDRAVLHPATERVTLKIAPEMDSNSRLILQVSSELGPEGRSNHSRCCADAGTEEYTYAIPLVRSVVQQYGGDLKIDWEAANAFTAEVRIPVAGEESLPEGA